MKNFADAPLRLDLLFADAPFPFGSLWNEACSLENQLAEKLKGMPIGTIVVFNDNLWFLQQRGDARVLCYAVYVEGSTLEFDSRFDFGLAYSDVEDHDLADYNLLITLAIEQFETMVMSTPPYVEQTPSAKVA